MRTLVIAAACFGALTAHASAQEDVYDPFESFNRRAFAVHEAIDEAVLEPVARGYRHVTPQPVRSGVSNFLRNLATPVTFVNDVLQGETERAATTFARFGLNTTVGVLGIFDPASDVGLEHHSEDFGQTLAVWGVPNGPYLFIPVLGPTTVRDGGGRVVDMAFQPLNHAEFDGDDVVRTSRLVATGVSAREAVLEAVDDLRENSIDPYVSYRTSYGLFRYSAIRNGRGDVQDLPEFEEIPEAERPAETPVAPEGPSETPPTAPNQAPETNPEVGSLSTDAGVLQ